VAVKALPALLAVLVLTGCSMHEHHYVWHQGGRTQSELDRDLAAARAEAIKAYPDATPFEAKAKKPGEAEAMLADMRNSVLELYMVTHGWHLVYFDRRGRMHAAHH
jgi:hypothetical protein